MNILAQSLWRDEAFSVLLARHNPLEIIRLTAGDATPPLHYLLLHYWIGLFGDSEVALRGLTILLFIATAVVMYFLGRLLNRRAGWWLALLSLTQPFLFYYGFEVRAYSQLAFLTALTIYFYLKPKPLLLLISALALLYTHLFGLWVVLILAAWAVYQKRPLWPLVAALVLYLPWLPNYLNFAQTAGGFLNPPTATDLLVTLLALGAPILIITTPYLKNLWQEDRFRMLLTLWALPIVGTFAISQLKPEFLDRYLIVTIPAQLLMVGLVARQRYANLLLGLIVLIQAVLSWTSFNNPQKQPFRDLAAAIRSQAKPGDAVVSGSSLTYFESQYYGLHAPIYSPRQDVPYYVGKVLIPDQDIVAALPVAKRLWLVELEESGGTLEKPLNLTTVVTRNFGRLKLTLYEP